MSEQTEAAAPTPYERLRYHYGIPDDLIGAYRTAILGEQAALVAQLTEALRRVRDYDTGRNRNDLAAHANADAVLAAADAQKSPRRGERSSSDG